MTKEEYSDLIHEYGKYAPTPEELYESIGLTLSLSYGEEAAKAICRAWSRKAAAKGYTAEHYQYRLF